jgi:hypothetical protein
MANQFGFVSEDTYAEKMDTQNMFLAAILDAQGGSVKPTSWQQVQTLNRAGLGSKIFAVGDQMTCERSGKTLAWDVIGIDHDTPADSQFNHTITLQLHDCLQTLQYDREEAFYYCETELVAGTYNVTFGISWGTNVVSGKSYQFTLTKAVPAGGQLVGFYRAPDTAPSTWTVASYESSKSTTALETVAVSEGTGGTSLCNSWTAAINGNVNSLHRAAYGSNNWVESAARQYLNSDAAAGSVWTPQTKWDRPPSWVTTQAGFMNGLDADFLAVIGETEKVTTQNTVCEDGNAQTTKDKFFFLSRPEVFCGVERSQVDEGSPYPYYSDYSDYTSPNTGADKNRIKYLNGSAQWWWLRTPNAGSGYGVRSVYTTGGLSGNGANFSSGVAPACNVI